MKRRTWIAVAALTCAALIGGGWMTAAFYRERRVAGTASEVPAETAEELTNPDRGVSPLFGWTLGEDDSESLADLKKQKNISLALVEINLKNYRKGPIGEEALKSLDAFLGQSAEDGRRLILRFLYDTDGTAALTEPDSIETVLEHMKQIGPLLAKQADGIYTLQGLFIGNWGEMNGSRFGGTDSLRRLYEALRQSTGGKIRLAVRTPAQWRSIVQEDVTERNALDAGLGLFNDGMTGSETDYGTYADGTESGTSGPESTAGGEDSLSAARPRESELAFQNLLCRFQPNGGEAIHPSAWNDFEQAVSSFREMHVTYLNPDYDKTVWSKWKQTRVSESGVFGGTDGAAYIRRHLGYRYVLSDSKVTYSWWRNRIYAACTFRNIGFAPAYETVTAALTLKAEDGRTMLTRTMTGDLRTLTGGSAQDAELTAQADFPAVNLGSGTYTLELSLRYGQDRTLSLGNVCADPDRTVYTVGTVTVR